MYINRLRIALNTICLISGCNRYFLLPLGVALAESNHVLETLTKLLKAVGLSDNS